MIYTLFRSDSPENFTPTYTKYDSIKDVKEFFSKEYEKYGFVAWAGYIKIIAHPIDVPVIDGEVYGIYKVSKGKLTKYTPKAIKEPKYRNVFH
jgi:hypothetical protein